MKGWKEYKWNFFDFSNSLLYKLAPFSYISSSCTSENRKTEGKKVLQLPALVDLLHHYQKNVFQILLSRPHRQFSNPCQRASDCPICRNGTMPKIWQGYLWHAGFINKLNAFYTNLWFLFVWNISFPPKKCFRCQELSRYILNETTRYLTFYSKLFHMFSSLLL